MVFIAVVCTSCASTPRQHPYVQSLSGPWGTKDTDECSLGPERVSYSPSRSKLYIRYPGEGGTTDGIKARSVLTYNVLYSTGNQTRVALVGEDRTDESGLPVTWDIVKVTESEYCWRRSDWGINECTIPRVRCAP